MFLLITLYLLPKCGAIPITKTRTNNSIDTDQAWVPMPEGRGTYDLILGCLSTLSLCIWISYHPNVHPRSGALKRLLRVIKWMLIALFAPEYMLYCAWNQRWAATKLLQQVNTLGAKAYEGHVPQEFTHSNFKTNYDSVVDLRLLDTRSTHHPPTQFDDSERSPSVYSRRDSMALTERPGDATSIVSVSSSPTVQGGEKHQRFEGWSIQQAFFAVSGGMIVDSSAWWYEAQLTIMPRGILELAKAGLLPKLSQASVSPRSRNEILGTLLVCVQSGWFLVHSVARLARKEPLTLLELHVLAHVVCAFFTYFLWMQKPCHHGDAVICTDKNTVGIAALFVVDAGAEERHFGTERFEYDRVLRAVDIKEVRSAHSDAHTHPSIWQRILRQLLQFQPSLVGLHQREPDNIDDFADPSFKSTNSTSQKMDTHLSLANQALSYLRAKSTAEHIANPESLSCVLAQLEQEPTFRFQDPHVASIDDVPTFGSSSLDISSDGSACGTRQITQSSIFALLSSLYGGAHIVAWSMHFPSTVEMWLWRGAGIAMAGLPVISLSYIVMAYVFDKVFESKVSKSCPGMQQQQQQHSTADLTAALRKTMLGSTSILITVLGVGFMAAYVLAKAFLLGEAFASLRSPLAGTYRDGGWTGYVPHVGS